MDYLDYYRDGKVKLDDFELEPKNSIDWECLNTENLDSLKSSINNFKGKNDHNNAMLSLSLDFLLKAIKEQKEVHDKIIL